MRSIIHLFDSKPSKYFFSQMAFGTAFTHLTSGIFLSGLAIWMGASDMLVGYISVIANICGVLILAFAAFFERFRSRKKLTIGLTIAAKLTTTLLVVLPAFAPSEIRIGVFVAVLIAAFTLQAQATVALNNWMIVCIGAEKRGRYISARQTLAQVVTVLLSLSAGFFLDTVQGQYIGFFVIFMAALLMGIIEVLLLSRIPDSIAHTPRGATRKLRDAIKIPLRDKAFMIFVVYIAVFYLLLNVADSFTTVYMIRYLELPYRLSTALSMLISLPQIVLLGIWGRISDTKGHSFVLKTSIGLFAGETLFMAFAAPHNYLVFIPIAFLIASVANSGFVGSVFNRRYELIPQENRIIYDNFYTASIGIGFILGPMLGNALKSLIETHAALAGILQFSGIRLLYIIATCGILLLQIAFNRLDTKRLNPRNVR